MAEKNKPNITVSNPTQYSDKPQKDGGTPELVVQELQIRAAIRTKQDIQTFRASQISAESRYSPNRSRLYDLYDDIRLDGHLSGIIQKRFDAVLNKPLFYRDKSGKEVKGMNSFILSREMRFIKRQILESILNGIAGIEFIPGATVEPRYIPIKHIKPKWQIISYEQNGQEGADYTELPNIWIIGEPEDLGILLKCAPYAIYKRGVFADWANFIEIFGQPVRIMYYDAHDKQTKIELKEILDESGSALALMVPKQAEFKMMDGKQTNGDGRLQETFVNSANAELSVIVLGNTETTASAKTGSFAKSKTHQEQQLEISKSDLVYVAQYLNDPHFIAILKSYGLPVTEGGYFEFNKDIDINFLSERIEIDKALKDELHLPMEDDYLYDTYGVPKPANYEEIKQEQDEEDDETEGVTETTPEEQPAPPPPPKGKSKKQKADNANLVSELIMEMRKQLPGFFSQAPE